MEPNIRKGVRRILRLDLRSTEVAAQDADRELDAFLAERIDQLVARGVSPSDAKREAIERLGGSLNDTRREFRDSAARVERRLRMRDRIDETLTDIRQTWRALMRSPVFSATIVLTLSLGIGATTIVFSVVNGVLLQSLPYPNPEQLVRVFETAPPAQGRELRSIAIPTIDDWRRDTRAFENIALYGSESFAMTGAGAPSLVQGTTTSSDLFTMLGAKPVLGRAFSRDEELPGAPSVVVMSHGMWLRRFGSDSTIVGRTILLDRQAFQVIGIMPRGFEFPSNTELWLPIGMDREYHARGARHMNGIARLKPGVTVAAATSDLLSAENRLAGVYPLQYSERGVSLIPLAERTVGNVRPALMILAGAVLLVLLVTCTNIANLLVARASMRQRETAVRFALGASRFRIARHLLLESLLLFSVAGAIGVFLSAIVIRAIRVYADVILPRVESIQLSAPVLGFALAITAITGIVFGLIPALQGSSAQPARSLLAGARGNTGGKRGVMLRSTMIVVETAMASMLLVGAGLLTRSMQQLRDVDPGLPTRDVLTFTLSLDPADSTDVTSRFGLIQERIAAVPGVTSVALASRLPLSGDDHSNSFYLPGDNRATRAEHSAQDRAVSAGYFRAMRIALVSGREFTPADGANSTPVAIVNESFARRWFDGDAVGKRFTPTGGSNTEREIVGIVRDTRQFGLDVPAEPEFYFPFAQSSWTSMSVAVHTRTDPLRMLGSVQNAIWALDRRLPLGNVTTLEATIAESGAQRRLVAVTLGAFAVLSYVLAAIGLYGVIAYAVTQRTVEFGIRLALGANPRSIAINVAGRGVLLAVAGGIIGLLAAIPLSGWLRQLLFGVSGTDGATYFAAGLLIPLVALLASVLPAVRAARIAPVTAMSSGAASSAA